MQFNTGVVKDFLFRGINVTDTNEFLVTSVIVGLVTILLEGMKMLILFLTVLIEQDPLTYAHTSDDDATVDKSPLFASLRIPSSIESIQRKRLKLHCLSFLVHTVNIFLGYLLMLAVMSYNVWITVAVIVGSGIGYYIFGALALQMKLKYSSLSHRHRNLKKDEFQINSGTEPEGLSEKDA